MTISKPVTNEKLAASIYAAHLRHRILSVGVALGLAFLALPASAEDQYLSGDWNGDGTSNLAVRRGNLVLKDTNGDNLHDLSQFYGFGDDERQYLIGDWNGDGIDNLAVLRENCVLMDSNFDGLADFTQCIGLGRAESEYLVGDWDGDGRDNIGLREGNCVLMDRNFDAIADSTQCYGFGDSEDQYLVGDWDGDGKDNLAVRRGNHVLMDFNFDGVADRDQTFGLGNSEQQYLVGDWDGDGKDNLAVLRGNCVHMDTNFDAVVDRIQCYGTGVNEPDMLSTGPTPNCGFFGVTGGSAPPMTLVDSREFADSISMFTGLNASKARYQVGAANPPRDGIVITIEDDPSVTLGETTIVLVNQTQNPKSIVGAKCAGSATTTGGSITAFAGQTQTMKLSAASSAVLALQSWVCSDWFCWSRHAEERFVFTENGLWVAFGGRKITFSWFAD